MATFPAPRLALVSDDHRSARAGGGSDLARVSHGWRQGKPAEDPEKTKRWGFITAKPSEYLIHMRRGRIRRSSTGQGASCFKWPWDSVAIIPTTINRLRFTADQVTLEKVGVQVSGLAVYRIVEPELTYRMLNFSYAERASEKLADIVGEMFVGATRRLIATLPVEEVMTRRKEAIAGALLAELAPVMRGQGQAADSTDRGWGVVLDTVEVQNVHILSESVFRDMQAEYRSRLAMRARQAELDSAQEIATREATSQRAIEEARLTAETATRERRAQAESRATEIEVAEAGKREALEARAAGERLRRRQDGQIAEITAQAEIDGERARREEQARLGALARDRTLAEAERELVEARHRNLVREDEMEAELALSRTQRQAELREAESAALALIRRRELELQRLTGELEAALARTHKDIDNQVSEDRIRMALVERSLPAVAGAFAQQFAEARFTQIGGTGADPGSLIAGSIAQVLELARSLGLRLGGPGDTAPATAPAPASPPAAAPHPAPTPGSDRDTTEA
ncbi:SPFH domain-containing protein [Haliangium sp.]|uniref:SPFH domain-containing protein n=1 Tax=Haliangium sp. TaxID=2663208 RepID=UPI003D0B0752